MPQRLPLAKFIVDPKESTPIGFVKEEVDRRGETVRIYNYRETFTPVYPTPRFVSDGKFSPIIIWQLVDSKGVPVVFFVPAKYLDRRKRDWEYHKQFLDIHKISKDVDAKDIRVVISKNPPTEKSHGRPVWGRIKVVYERNHNDGERTKIDGGDELSNHDIWKETMYNYIKKHGGIENIDEQKLINAMKSEKGAEKLSNRYGVTVIPLDPSEAIEVLNEVRKEMENNEAEEEDIF